MNLEKSEIADVLDVTVEHYRKLEAGITGISVDKVLTLYHKYGIDIFDIEMPEMNGLQLAKEIRKIDAKALFVFLTGYTQYVMDVNQLQGSDCLTENICHFHRHKMWTYVSLLS